MTLEQRLEKLERENRWMRRIGAALVSVLAAILFVAQADDEAPRNLQCQSLAVKGKKGRTRIELGTSGEAPFMRFYDTEGNVRLVGALHADGSPRLYLASTPVIRKGRMEFYVDENGYSGIELFDRSGHKRLTVTAGAEDVPSLTVLDRTGKIIWKAPSND